MPSMLSSSSVRVRVVTTTISLLRMWTMTLRVPPSSCACAWITLAHSPTHRYTPIHTYIIIIYRYTYMQRGQNTYRLFFSFCDSHVPDDASFERAEKLFGRHSASTDVYTTTPPPPPPPPTTCVPWKSSIWESRPCVEMDSKLLIPESKSQPGSSSPSCCCSTTFSCCRSFSTTQTAPPLSR